MHEINTIAGRHGNPGMTLALNQLSTRPEALIRPTDAHQLEQARRDNPSTESSIWLIPLFKGRLIKYRRLPRSGLGLRR